MFHALAGSDADIGATADLCKERVDQCRLTNAEAASDDDLEAVEGVGAGRSPQEGLWPGDVVEAEVTGIGRLRHPVVAI